MRTEISQLSGQLEATRTQRTQLSSELQSHRKQISELSDALSREKSTKLKVILGCMIEILGLCLNSSRMKKCILTKHNECI